MLKLIINVQGLRGLLDSTVAFGSLKVSGGWELCGGVCDASIRQGCHSNLCSVLFGVDYETSSLILVPLF
jgi:hypothetical protein